MKSHYIDEKSGALVSELLALRRMHHKDHISIKGAIVDILDEYEIREKTVSITTDNAGEFRCAFNKFSENFERFRETYDGPGEFDLGDDNDNDFLLNAFLTQHSLENENEDHCSEVIRGPEIIENASNIMPMVNDVRNEVFSGSKSTFVRTGTDKFVLLDLESICRDANRACDDQQFSCER